MVRLSEELEIVLVVANSECVENIIHSLKSINVKSDVFWMKDTEQALDFIESRGAYVGKKPTKNPKLFVLDGRFDVNDNMTILDKVATKPGLRKSDFYVLAKTLDEENRVIFSERGVELVDDSFKVETLKGKVVDSSFLGC